MGLHGRSPLCAAWLLLGLGFGLGCSSTAGVHTSASPVQGVVPSDLQQEKFANTQTTIRVVTWNVNYSVGPDDRFLQSVSEMAPDILVLQETSIGFGATYLAALHSTFPYAWILPSAHAAGGIAILSRFPLRRARVLPSPRGQYAALSAIVDAPIGSFQLLALHLYPPLHRSSILLGALLSPSYRAQELTSYLAHLDVTRPTLVLGDLNESTGAAIRALRQVGLLDVVTPDHSTRFSWHWGVGPFQFRRHYDHIFYSRSWVLLQSAIIRTGNSDHYPVSADFSLADARPR